MALNRELLLESSLRLLFRDGYSGVSVVDIAAEAGFTHGVIYGQFKSKEDMLLQTLSSLDRCLGIDGEAGFPTIDTYTERLVREAKAGDLESGCAFSALGAELARTSTEIRTTLTQIIGSTIDSFTEAESEAGPHPTPSAAIRKATIRRWTSLIGALVLARISVNHALTAEILDSIVDLDDT
ncbi:TetR/AcrR family transcriptional regulator [Paraburkholderia sp. GAS199]|uniref:TetR/AcrR family transcriptional regulator n=1 Tax=Paraburkholderia sp. GAS199 TaxID=3035126 RepID=UPI003D255C11